MTRKEYYEKHKFCPKCGSNNNEQTLVGYGVEMGVIDENKVKCICGWEGIVNDLIENNTLF